LETPDTSAQQTGTSFPHTAYEQLQQSGWSQRGRLLQGNWLARAVLMLGIFAVGAGAGLATTWWLKKANERPVATATIRPAEPRIETPASSARGALPIGGLDAIRPGERPYEDVPADVTAERNESSAPSTDVPTMNNAERQTADNTLGKERVPKENEDNVVAAMTPPAKTSPQATVAAAQPDAGSGADTPSAGMQEKKVPKATPRRYAPIKSAKNKEIDRIKQQAADELKKKSDKSVAVNSHRSTTQSRSEALSSVTGGSRAGLLARCENAPNFILRERCKWQVCNGMWGKNGCPAYEKQASSKY
jgi:hypothetical protein